MSFGDRKYTLTKLICDLILAVKMVKNLKRSAIVYIPCTDFALLKLFLFFNLIIIPIK